MPGSCLISPFGLETILRSLCVSCTVSATAAEPATQADARIEAMERNNTMALSRRTDVLMGGSPPRDSLVELCAGAGMVVPSPPRRNADGAAGAGRTGPGPALC